MALKRASRLLGQAGEDHGNVITGVLVSRAGNDHAGAMDLPATSRGDLQRQTSFPSKVKTACRCGIRCRFCE